MNSIWKNYASTLLLIAGLVVGGLCGVLFPQATHAIKPLGDIFLNLLFVLVVPLVFFSVAMAFSRLHTGGGTARVLVRTVFAFASLWLVCGILSYLSTLVINPLGDASGISSPECSVQPKNWSEALTGALSVPDFPMLFSKGSLLPLIVFSALLGTGVALTGEKGKPFAEFIQSGNAITAKTMSLLMKAAPIGLGCYFAGTIASVGGHLLGGYMRVFIIYWVLTLIVVLGLFPAIIRIARGRGSVRDWFKHILPPSLTAMATESSSVAIPGNIEAACGMGIDENVAETVVPLGTNLLKAGSVIGDVLKITFLLSLCGQTASPVLCILLAILASVVTGAVVGGNVTGELLICTMLGLPPEMVGIIMIIGTIIDIPATLVNSQSTVVAAAITDRP